MKEIYSSLKLQAYFKTRLLFIAKYFSKYPIHVFILILKEIITQQIQHQIKILCLFQFWKQAEI